MDVMDDFLEPHKLRCFNCNTIFTTVLPKIAVFQGRVKCPRCRGNTHLIIDCEDNPRPDFLAKNLNIPMSDRSTTSDMYDSLLYSFQKKLEQDTRNKIETYFFNTEENNMKRTTNNNEETRNFEIVRKYTTERGIFTVGQLEPTDMFALIDDEDQEVYMAVYEEEPKYKTKKAVVSMYSGNLLYFDLETKIHVYRPGSSELRVGEFLYSSKDYK